MRAWLPVLAIAAACGSGGGPSTSTTSAGPRDAGPADVAPPVARPVDAAPPPPVVARPLAGPYPSLKAAVAAWAPAPKRFAVVTLATTPVGAAELALVRVDDRAAPAAASCALAVRIARATYLGPGFLCQADRSDERIGTVATAGAAPGELWFTVSYQRDDVPVVAVAYALQCDVTSAPPVCTEPPAIGGDSFDCSSVGPPGYCP
ncbi:MAG: hypothetical protein IPL61_20560 [Myxococcales bacterium]|nr:hypothetical protein [Myxococcales bacterium]